MTEKTETKKQLYMQHRGTGDKSNYYKKINWHGLK